MLGVKLNNKGFGTKEMIAYTCAILIFLLIVTFLISSLYSDLEEASKANQEAAKQNQQTVVEQPEEPEKTVPVIDYDYYYNKEILFKTATRNYLISNSYHMNGDILKIDLKDLVGLGYILPIYDQIDNTECIGYSNVLDKGEGYEIYSYLKCSNYTSGGY